jgi:hypothetical protein
MAGDHRLRLDDDQRTIPARPELPENDPESTVLSPESNLLLCSLIDGELLSQSSVLDSQGRPGQQRRPEDGVESRCQCLHEVSECSIEGVKLVREVSYEVFAEHGYRCGSQGAYTQS